MTYIISNRNNSVWKQADTKQEAEKIKFQLSKIFDEQFSIKEHKDIWAVNFNK